MIKNPKKSVLADRQGFTLIELLIVIGIIGILSAIVFAATSGSRAQARDAKRINDLNQLVLSMESYYEQQPRSDKEYPINPEPCPSCDGTVGHISGFNMLVTAGILQALPADPSAGKIYYYSPIVTNGMAEGFCLGAILENQNNAAAGTVPACSSVGFPLTVNYELSR